LFLDAALNDIKSLQKTTMNLIPFASFARLVKEISQNLETETPFRWTKEAVTALQDASEAYVTSVFQDAMMAAIHARRVTLVPKDIQLALHIRREDKPKP
jgi:histone H3